MREYGEKWERFEGEKKKERRGRDELNFLGVGCGTHGVTQWVENSTTLSMTPYMAAIVYYMLYTLCQLSWQLVGVVLGVVVGP